MAKFVDKIAIFNTVFNETNCNGLMICDIYIPEEVLIEIFCRIDYESLLNCQLICKRWRIIIQNNVWRKKAHFLLGELFPNDKKIPWQAFYLICKKKPFERNLVKNHSGEKGSIEHWDIECESMENLFVIQSPPIGVSKLPNILMFEEGEFCFASSFHTCFKTQSIDLLTEGFHPYILDVLQPPITISEWFCFQEFDQNNIYKLHIDLEGFYNNGAWQYFPTLDRYNKVMNKEKTTKRWLYASQVIRNYGNGLRKITLKHAIGNDFNTEPNTYYGKITGSCICVEIPSVTHSNDIGSYFYHY